VLAYGTQAGIATQHQGGALKATQWHQQASNTSLLSFNQDGVSAGESLLYGSVLREWMRHQALPHLRQDQASGARRVACNKVHLALHGRVFQMEQVFHPTFQCLS
jgi:hypothetical protein